MLRLLPLLLLLGLTADAARPDRLSAYPRLDRRDRLGGGKSGPLLSMALTATGASECDGSTPSGLTFTRASAATCTRSDGTIAHLAANQPRVSARGLLVEGSATNLVLHGSDLSQAAWTKTGITCTKNAAGPDGITNSASSCNSTGASTVTQTLTTAAATRSTSLYIRGTGCTFGLSRDGGATTASVTPPAFVWHRLAPSCLAGDTQCTAVPALSSGIANPAIQISTSGVCSYAVALVQDEAGAYATSPIVTAGTSATRAGDVASVPNPGVTSAAGCWAMSAQTLQTTARRSLVLAGTTATYLESGNVLRVQGAGIGTQVVLPVDVMGREVRMLTAWDQGAANHFLIRSVTDGVQNTGTPASYVPVGEPPGAPVYLGGEPTRFWLNGHISNLVIANTTGGCQ